jgi:hypothetical protein
MSLFQKETLTKEEYILKYSLIYLGLRKLPDDKLDKVKNNEDNQKYISDFLDDEGRAMFLLLFRTHQESRCHTLPSHQSDSRAKQFSC